MPVLEQEPGQGQDTALVEQLKALVKQSGDVMKQNADLAALLKESKRKLDVMTKNAERAKKNYISEKKANNRKYEDRKEELKQIIGNLNVKHDATRQEVADLNAAMHFVLERGHDGKYFNKVGRHLYINPENSANGLLGVDVVKDSRVDEVLGLSVEYR